MFPEPAVGKDNEESLANRRGSLFRLPGMGNVRKHSLNCLREDRIVNATACPLQHDSMSSPTRQHVLANACWWNFKIHQHVLPNATSTIFKFHQHVLDDACGGVGKRYRKRWPSLPQALIIVTASVGHRYCNSNSIKRVGLINVMFSYWYRKKKILSHPPTASAKF